MKKIELYNRLISEFGDNFEDEDLFHNGDQDIDIINLNEGIERAFEQGYISLDNSSGIENYYCEIIEKN